MSIDYIINTQPNSLNFDFSTAFTSFPPPTEAPPVDPIVVETSDETEEDESISYAELTKVRFDEAVKKKARPFSKTRFTKRKKFISVRDARSINLKAKTEIIPLSSEKVVRFPVDRFIRERLKRVEKEILATACKELGFAYGFFIEIISERNKTILKNRAVECNDYFKKILKNNSEQFDLERIFRLALKEPLSEKPEKKLCERIWIKYEDKYREQLEKLRDTVEDPRFNEVKKILDNRAVIGLKDVVIIHKFSEEIVLDVTKESVVRVPVLPEHLEKLKSLRKEGKVKDETIRTKIYHLINGRYKDIEYQTAKNINSCLGTKVFDIEALLARGIREAEEEFLSPSKKRRSPSEDPCEPSVKRQRTGEPTATVPVPRSTKYEAAPFFIEMVDEPL